MDIDYFKTINDTHGHAAGDDVLKKVSAIMAQNLRPYDRLFRTGGEEFTALLPNTDEVAACEVAERLRKIIEASTVVTHLDIELHVTLSIGVAVSSRQHDEGSLVEAADAALYRAKSAGRNRYVLSGADDAHTH
ncbi:MAG: GGDEF domain-containing protein, partial [Parahaliea sp.]